MPANTSVAARGVGGFLREEDSEKREGTTIVWKDLMNVKPLGIIVRGLSPIIACLYDSVLFCSFEVVILIPSGRKACKMSAFQRGRGILPLMQALLSVLRSPSDSPLAPTLCAGVLTDVEGWQMRMFPWDEHRCAVSQCQPERPFIPNKRATVWTLTHTHTKSPWVFAYFYKWVCSGCSHALHVFALRKHSSRQALPWWKQTAHFKNHMLVCFQVVNYQLTYVFTL